MEKGILNFPVFNTEELNGFTRFSSNKEKAFNKSVQETKPVLSAIPETNTECRTGKKLQKLKT